MAAELTSTSPLIAKLFSALVANLFQTLVALLWISGVRKIARPLPSDITANLLAFSLVFPIITALLQICGFKYLFDTWILVRADVWAAALIGIRTTTLAILIFFLAAIALIFFLQEVIPFWQSRRGLRSSERSRDKHIDATLARIFAKSERLGLPKIDPSKLRAFRLESDTSVAALSGLFRPELLVSRGLLHRLTNDELEAVIAHEWAHYYYGGNLRMFLIWIFRALQAPNPAALIMFRSLIENQEAACDALAAWVTKSPQALARAIVKVHDDGQEARPIEELATTADSMATRLRVAALKAEPPKEPSRWFWSWMSASIIGTLIWVIR